MDVLVNGSTVSEAYVLEDDTAELTLTGVYAKDGMLDVKIQSAYNADGEKEEAVLCGITAEKQIRKEIVSRINAGGDGQDGLIADQKYETANGAGYYDAERQTSQSISTATSVTPDAGIGTAMKTAREGKEFGYKVKAMPGNYRVKLYFADFATEDHEFDIYVNDEKVEEAYNIKEEAGGENKSAGYVYETESKDGFIDVKFKGVNGKKAMVNAVIVEAYDKPSGDKLTIAKATGGSEQSGKTAEMSIDGNHATRWASVAGDTNGQYITYELDGSYILNGIVLDWTPNAMAKDYHIDLSDDGKEWETVATVTDAKQGLNVHKFDSAVGKYVRIVCDEKLNQQYAISLTEAEIYGGAKVEGEAHTTVSFSDDTEAADSVNITAGMGYVYKRYSTAEVTFQYDPAEVQYVEDSVKMENEDNLDAVQAISVDEEKGIVTQRFGMKKWNAFQGEENKMLTAQFKNLTDSMTTVDVQVSLTSSDGHVTELPGAKAYLPAEADFDLMTTLLSEAEELAKTAVVGDKRDEYPQESVDALNEAIETAKKLNKDSDQAEVNKAARGLYDALELMKDTKVESKYTMYHKDFTNAGETAPEVSTAMHTAGGANPSASSSIEDGRWNLTLGVNTIAKMTDATPLDKGYYYVRLNVSDITNQTLFGIYGKEDGVRRLRTGYEGGTRYFWDGSNAGYGDWGNGDPIAANEDVEIMMKFDSSQGNVTKGTLWVNGKQVGQKELQYTSGTGIPSMETRAAGKTFSVEEIYFTDSEPVTLTVSSEGAGSVNRTGAVTAFKEADKTFYFTPEEGATIEGVKVDGQDVEWDTENNSYTFEYLSKDHTLEVTFSGETPTEEIKSYHADYMVDTEADFAGERTTATVEDNKLKISAEGWNDKNNDNNPAVAVDQNAPALSSGTFYTRFTVESSGIQEGADIGQDQVLFDIKTNGTDVIRIGFDYISEGSTVGNWFYGKAKNGGWGNFPKGQGVPALTEGEEHTLKVTFTRTEEDTYTLQLWADGQDMGTVENVKYTDTEGRYGFGARRTAKNYTISEVYYTNAAERKITVKAGENGTVS